jgi:hypothetical protein
MKIHLTDGSTAICSGDAKNLDTGVNTPLIVRNEQGTHISKISTGINDEEVTRMVKEHLAAVQRREDWETRQRVQKGRGWMGRLFPSEPSEAPPLPDPLPSYIVARARELGLIQIL